jgi:phosphoadenosine phosphosulfate reductase
MRVSIARLQEFEPTEGFYVAFSGGKDSMILLEAVRRSGVKNDVHYNDVGIDPPELRQFIRDFYPEVVWERPKESFGKAMLRKMFLPMRKQRWCCELLKEGGGPGRFVVTGIRAAESARRAKRNYVETCEKDYVKRYLHPIIDWPTEAVWAYIADHRMPYCTLYDEGYERLGCVFCPMRSVKYRVEDVKRWPKLAHAFVCMIRKLMKQRQEGCKRPMFGTWDAEEAFHHWITKDRRAKVTEVDENQQCFRFEDN